MGGKRKYMILLAAIFPFTLSGQDYSDFRYADSVTYKLYLDGRWDELISEGRKTIQAGTDYKFLRQRLGFAYYIKGDYTRALSNFSKALSYDSYDQFTLEYLSYAYAGAGKSGYAGVLESKMNLHTRENAGIVPFRFGDYADIELNYKRTSTQARADAFYYRVGLVTKAGSRLDIYQSYSSYGQTITNNINSDTIAFRIRQPQYYIGISFNASRHLIFSAAYNYIHTVSGGWLYPAHLFNFAISPDFEFVNLNIEQSALIVGGSRIYQSGLTSTISFPGSSSFYVRGTVAAVYDGSYSNFVYTPAAGIKLWKGGLLEGYLTTGGLEWYNDFHGLYVYNSYDPVKARAGATLYQAAGKNSVIWFNYALEKKSFFENSSFGYKQFSFLAGIRWKL